MAEPSNDPAHNPALARRNTLFGWALFGIFVLLFVLTVVVAFVYLAVVD